jgi:Ca-activated chloride channel family protein
MSVSIPEWLWSLAALPLLGLWAWLGARRRARDWQALGQGGRPARDGSALWLAAASCLALALAGPRWGRSDRPVTPGHDVVLAVDVSRSMGAEDAVPDRLGAAVAAARSLVAALGNREGERAAVVAFAGRGVLRCPLTANLGAVTDRLLSLRPGDVRPGGTDLGAGLDAALDAFDDQDRDGGRTVVLFSDGEDHARRWRYAAERLRARGIVVHTVALGDAEAGHPVPSRPEPGAEPIRERGSVVLSKRSDESLAAIARETGGVFLPLGLAAADLGRLYATRIEPAATARRRAVESAGRAERFPLFLAVALLFGLAASWPGRPRPYARRGRDRGRGRSRGRVAAGLAGAVALGLGIGAGPGDDPAAAVRAGRRAYQAGRFDEALTHFRRAQRLAPGRAVPAYDAAAALFQLGRFPEAMALYADARTCADADAALRTRIDYALGNTALALGDLPRALRHYDDCLASTARGPGLDRVRGDAAVNRRFVEAQARNPFPAPSSDDAPRGTGPSPRGPGEGQDKGKGERPSGRPGGEPSRTDEGGGGAIPPPGDQSPPPGARGAGGAGGSATGHAPPRAGSPGEQLDRALDNVREARRRRLDELPPARGGDGEERDW